MSTDKKSRWKEKLNQASAELEELLTSLDETQLQTPVISEGNSWTSLDILAHLVENERGMSIHVHKIRQGQETVPEDFDLDRWNAGLKERTDTSLSLTELLEDQAQVRARTIQEIDSLGEEDWQLQGRHPARGVITVEQYYETMIGHIHWHIGDIKQGLGLETI